MITKVNKIDSVPQYTLAQLISKKFDDNEVEAAKGLLCTHVADSVKAGNRRGQNKKQLNIQDIYKMTLECNRDELPSFVALNLAKLPPVSIDCIDVSALMRRQQLMEIEMSHVKSMIDDVLKVSVETSQRVETVLAGGVSKPSYTRETAPASGRAEPADRGVSSRPANGPQSAETGQSAPGQSNDPHPRRDGAEAGAAVSYATVAALSATSLGDGWSVANKAKRGKAPVVKPAAKASP